MTLDDDLLKKSNKFEVLDNIAFSTRTVSKELSEEFLKSLNASISKIEGHKIHLNYRKECYRDYIQTKEQLLKLESEIIETENEMKTKINERDRDLSKNNYALTKLQNNVIESSKKVIAADKDAIQSCKKHVDTLEKLEIIFNTYENNIGVAVKELKDIRKSVKIYSRFNFTIERYKILIDRYDSEIEKYNEFIKGQYRHPTPGDDTNP